MKEHGKALDGAVEKALGESQGATGGFLLYDEFKPELLKLIIEDQVVRPYARIVPMAMETILFPRIVDLSHKLHPGREEYPLSRSVTVVPLADLDKIKVS